MTGVRGIGRAARRRNEDVPYPEVRAVSSATVGWDDPAKVGAKPAGTQEGDLLVAVASCDYGLDADFQLPAGFEQQAFLSWGDNYAKLVVGTKVAGASEPAEYTFGVPVDADARIDVIAVQGVDAAKDVRATATTTPAGLEHTAPTITPVTRRDLLLTVLSSDTGTGGSATMSWTGPAEATELTDLTANGFINQATYSQPLTVGQDTSGRVFTMTSSTGAQQAFAVSLSVPSAAPLAPAPKRALVYRGGAGNMWASKACADVLLSHPTIAFEVEFIGENEPLKLTAANLAGADLYVQPAGPTVEEGWPYVAGAAADVEAYVKGGGRFAGFCWGAWVMNANGTGGAGAGFNLTPYPTGLRQAFTNGATLTTAGPAFDKVTWGDEDRWLYCEDPNYFHPDNETLLGSQVLARFNNGNIAAMLLPSGDGWAVGVGPHPEASGPDEDDWWGTAGTDPDGKDWDLAHAMITAVMEAGGA